MEQKELIKIIEKAKREGAKKLDLSDKGITELPAEIGRLVNLERLDINNNQLNSLPEEIGQLENLRELAVCDKLTENK